ncbi:MAG TPA: hypothetical protein VLJ14_13950 [Ktedonobacterales bacterium]|nr:hypothetical protein [Ktedonobacterales bacterium]
MDTAYTPLILPLISLVVILLSVWVFALVMKRESWDRPHDEPHAPAERDQHTAVARDAQ